MIYPTPRAIVVLAASLPIVLIVGIAIPAGWLAGPALVALAALMLALDAIMGGSRSGLTLTTPDRLTPGLGRPGRADFTVRFGASGSPRHPEAALAADRRLGLIQGVVAATRGGEAAHFSFPFVPGRRGPADISRLWVRWTGPLGLVWKQKVFDLDDPTTISTDLQAVRDEAVKLFARDALFGAKSQIELGEGSEFQALRDFQPGMDRRAIDWKQSARHSALLAKEFRTERNHHVIMALDCGRVMSEPVGGMPRVDRAIHASLLLAYACLRSGDRAGLYAFDSAPRVSTGAAAGLEAFRSLQMVAGRIDYSTNETNYTLALSSLAGTLKRRSLVVVFTDFTDSTAAELMIESLGRLLRRHLVLFVVLRDEELEGLAEAEANDTDDVARAVVASGLLRERDLVVTRLRRMGVHIVDTPADRMGPAVINAYLDLKRRDLL